MKLVGRIPVEPLDDERMTNIERRIVAGAADAAVRPAQAPRRHVGFAMAALAALITGVIGWQLGGGTEPATVAGDSLPIKINTEAERATLDIGDAVIQSDPDTAFVVTRPAGGVLVAMTRGKVELEVGKRGDRAALVVRAGDTDVIVVGTHFSVDYGDGTGEVDVRVTEGVVKVVRQQQEVRVAAGQAWQSRRGRLALADVGGPDGPRAATQAGTELRAPRPQPADTTDGATDPTGPVAAIAPANTQRGSGFEIDMTTAPDLLHGRTSQVPDGRVPSGARTGSGSSNGATSGSGAMGPRTVTEDPKDPMRDIKKLIRGQHVEPALDVGKIAAQAIGEYHTIIREQDGEAESRAFYSIAVTQHLQLGRNADALNTLDGYFRRFAQGKRYSDYQPALWLRVRVLCLQKIDDRCRAAAYRYSHEVSGTPAAAIAERITLTE
ncbi:MAG: FecR domain-containing protein [Deltaproteobacteria bacterium]|nr:FecR domain-containing protein [Deltaproteobacteria bacterium]